MTLVSEILPSEHIFVGADWRSKKRVFEQASIVFENACGVARDKFFSALIQRERLGSTFIGEGGAIPHGRMEEAPRPLCALALLKKPIQYGIGEDGGAVRTLFFLIAPAGADDKKHLAFLGQFSAMLSDASLVEQLHQCETADAAAELLASWERKRGNATPE